MVFKKNLTKKLILLFGFSYICVQYLKYSLKDTWNSYYYNHFEKDGVNLQHTIVGTHYNLHQRTNETSETSYSQHIPFIETPSGRIRICTQKERKDHLRETCENMSDRAKQRKVKLERLLVDHEHKLVYCVIPKAACTTWKGIMANRTSKGYNQFGTMKHWIFPDLVFSPGYLHRAGLDYVRDNYTEYWNSTYVHYTKFIIVRDPLQRVLSAYYDKLRDKTPWVPFLRLMRNAFNRTGDVPFKDFVHFLITPGYGHRADIHWTTYESLCFPCHIHYDYILRVETMDYDQNLILPLLGAKRRNPLPKLNLSPNSNAALLNKTNKYNDYLTIESKELNQLLMRYVKDSMAFGYDFDWRSKKSYCEIRTKNGDICC